MHCGLGENGEQSLFPDVTSAMLKNSKTAAILVIQTNSVGVEPIKFLCKNIPLFQ